MKIQVTDLGGKSSANLTYFGCKKTFLFFSQTQLALLENEKKWPSSIYFFFFLSGYVGTNPLTKRTLILTCEPVNENA